MKKLACLCSLGCLLLLSACASKPQPPALRSMQSQQSLSQKQQEETKNTEIIGTWQWVLDNGTPVKQTYYVRYYSNGKIASWPFSKDASDSQGVAHGRYSTTKKFLTLEMGSKANSSKSRLIISGPEMLITTADGRQLGYRRVTPALTPGKLPDGKPAGFAQQ